MSISDARPARSGGALYGDYAGPLLMLLCILAPVPVFWSAFGALAEAWSRAEYSHGPLIPLLSGFLFMREMSQVPPPTRPVTDRWAGVALVGVAMALAVLGNLINIDHIVFYGIILWVGGVVLIGFGFRRGWVFWPAVLHLIFMLPLPQFLYWQMNIQLQYISSEIGVALVRAAGIPVYLDGNVIDLGVYQLLVAEACSGLRYLFPIMSFSYIFCALYRGPWWHKAILLLAAVPLAVLMNSFRIGMIGVLVDNYGIEHAQGFLHYFEGWVIFGACVGLLFLLARTLQWLARDRRPLSEALNLEFTGMGAQFRRFLDTTPSLALAVAAFGTVAVSAVWLATPKAEAVVAERTAFDFFPRNLAGRVAGPPIVLEPGVARVLAADDYFGADYAAEGQFPIEFFSAYYANQTDGSSIHSPEACLPGGGWEMFDLDRRLITLPPEAGVEPFHVVRAIIQKGQAKQLVYYWSEQRGRRTTGELESRVWQLYDAIKMGRTDGALVRLITPLPPQGGIEEADARLTAFMAELMPELGAFIPR